MIAGADGALPDRRTPRPNSGVDVILGMARGRTPEDRLVMLSIGMATDVASALLVDLDLSDRIEITGMAVDGWPDGNDGRNARNDLCAWQVWMNSRAPITMGDAAVCKYRLTLFVAETRERIAGCGRGGDDLVGLLADWLPANLEIAEQVTGGGKRWPVWDEVIVCHLPGLTTSSSRPRPALRDDMMFDHDRAASNELPPVRWISDIDAEGLCGDLRARHRQDFAA